VEDQQPAAGDLTADAASATTESAEIAPGEIDGAAAEQVDDDAEVEDQVAEAASAVRSPAAGC
jgi:Mce-associated membrane protein